jgi:hypothetical protein
MKKIIICIDFSPEAKNAMHYGAALAKEKGSDVLLFSLQNTRTKCTVVRQIFL